MVLMTTATEGETWDFRGRIEEDSPFFEGHFPGNPVLPAIAQLHLLLGLMRRNVSSTLSIVEIQALRLQHPIRPGDEIEVSVAGSPGADSTAFSIQCGGRIASRGRVRWNETLPGSAGR